MTLTLAWTIHGSTPFNNKTKSMLPIIMTKIEMIIDYKFVSFWSSWLMNITTASKNYFQEFSMYKHTKKRHTCPKWWLSFLFLSNIFDTDIDWLIDTKAAMTPRFHGRWTLYFIFQLAAFWAYPCDPQTTAPSCLFYHDIDNPHNKQAGTCWIIITFRIEKRGTRLEEEVLKTL